jgi:hypothetical protein
MEPIRNEGSRSDHQTTIWPALPRVAVKRIASEELEAQKQLQADIFPYSPWNPTFVFAYGEVNRSCAKLIEFLTDYAATAFDCWAEQYTRHHPSVVLLTDLLREKVASDVRTYVNEIWDAWVQRSEMGLMGTLPEKSGQDTMNGSRDHERFLLDQYERRIEAVFNGRVDHWRSIASENDSVAPTPTPVAHVSPMGANSPGCDEALPSRAEERKRFVGPLLDNKGWSTEYWAGESDVDFKTANDYLQGSTMPRRSTRAKLAKALGVKVSDLPK